MNAKKAKLLRKAAGYKNQSKTPGLMDFPGIARMARVPMLDIHGATKTSYCYLPLTGKFVKVSRIEERLTLRNNKPIMLLYADGVDEAGNELAGTPKFSLVAMSKPGKLRAGEPKGSYRRLKKLAILFDRQARPALAPEFEEELADSEAVA